MNSLATLIRFLACLAAGVLLASVHAHAAQPAAQPPPAELKIPSVGKWRLETSHAGVEAQIDPPPPEGLPANLPPGAGFTLTYRFVEGAGFAISRLIFPAALELPENYELSFSLQGKGPSNDLEVKLLDEPHAGTVAGASVWWVKRRNFEWPEGSPVRINNKAKHFQFAWGPLNGARIKRVAGIEIVVASSSGGEGAITVTNVQLRPLPPSVPYTGAPTASASSAQEGHGAALALDNDPKSAWVDDDNTAPEWTVDFGSLRDLDALRIDWASPIKRYSVLTADDANGPWHSVWTAEAQDAVSRSYADIPDTTARLLKVVAEKAGGAPTGIADVRFLTRPNVAGAENLGVWPLIAADFPQSAMPRYFSGRQSSWTVLGAPGVDEETLVNEEGDVELCHSGPMVSALVVRKGQGAEAWSSSSQRMDLDVAPTAVVERRNDRLALTTSVFASRAWVVVKYELACVSDAEEGQLALCLRPFQVDPPWQFLNVPGGVARVKSILRSGDNLLVNNAGGVMLPRKPSRVSLMTFADGEAGAAAASGAALPTAGEVVDPHGFASAAALYPFSLRKGERAIWTAVLMPRATRPDPGVDGQPVEELDASMLERVRNDDRWMWATLDSFKIHLPPGNEQLAASIRASLAYIQINKDGPGFQPGSRSYERSWIRDGSLTGAALLEFGLTDDVKKFIDWYAGFQFPTGAIPCVVDKRGADPVVENDSHGQFIYALAEYHRYTHDDAFVTKHFEAVEKAVEHIQSERAETRPDRVGRGTWREPGKPAVPFAAATGLMPASISHEGYSAKPMHSYWDDMFTLKGLRDAAYLARVLKKNVQAGAFTAAADDMASCIKSSIEQAQKAHGIGYIPGCVELGDFDATSTTVAINPCGMQNDLPREWYDATFGRWWDFFEARRDGRIDWVDYTPYEWRIVGTLVMLGQRERAWEATKWYLQDQLPPRKTGDTSASGWLHWAEIVHKDHGAGKWIGDMPHTWVASDFLRSVRTMFVHEEPAPAKDASNLVLFAGVPAEWADAPGGVSFKGLRTPYGPLNASLKKDGEWYELSYSGLERAPFRVRLAPPVAWPPKQFEVLEGGGAANDKQGGVDGITTGMRIRFK